MKQWYTAAELADLALPGLARTKRGLNMMADARGWNDPQRAWHAKDNPGGIWRRRAARGGGSEYHLSALPAEAQMRLAAEAEQAEPVFQEPVERARLSAEQHWEWFDGQSDKVKAKAQHRLGCLTAVDDIEQLGQNRDFAINMISAQRNVSARSIWRWFDAVAGLDRHNWLPALADRHAGGGKAAELEPEAWEHFKADYLRLGEPAMSDCYRRLKKLAAKEGWSVPSEKSLARRIEREISPTVLVLARQGIEALKKMFPPMKRDRSSFHALEALNGDGHKWDVFVKFPDGTIGRPMMVAFQDLYSNKMVAWRFDKSENREAIRLALGDVVEQFGLPKHIWFDNTRAFANKWLTGGASFRYRFKTRDEDPVGLCEAMGIKVHFTRPYSGQSKPIERAFRDFAQGIAKHPAFAGAYVGNSPLAKPEDYGSRAVAFDDFVQIVTEEIHEWNARDKRRTDIAQGLSFDAVFEESYTRNIALIAKPSEAMMRQWRLAADDVRVRPDGSIMLLGNRFWDDFLSDRIGSKVVVRFDPQNIHAGLHIYDKAGRYIGFAPVIEAQGFNDGAAAREHGRQKNAFMRAKKAMLAAERSMDALTLAQRLPRPEEPTTPDRDHVVVQHIFPTAGSAALAAQAVPTLDQIEQEDASNIRFLGHFTRGLRLMGEDD